MRRAVRRRTLTVLAAAAVGVVAVLGLFAAIVLSPSASPAEIEREVHSMLRCPVCAGESIADSTAPVAVAMREEVSRQLSDGRPADDVLDWFAEAYGAGILLDPRPRGAGLLMWAMPVAAVSLAAVAVMVFLRGHDRRRRVTAVVAVAAVAVAVAVVVDLSLGPRDGAAGTADTAPPAPEQGVALGALADSARERPGDAAVRAAYGLALHGAGETGAAATELGAAARLRPADSNLAFLHASLLAESGQADAAGEALEHVLAAQPEHAPALLARGTMLVQAGDERGYEMLEDFLRLAPEDPAADDVRRLLGGSAGERG